MRVKKLKTELELKEFYEKRLLLLEANGIPFRLYKVANYYVVQLLASGDNKIYEYKVNDRNDAIKLYIAIGEDLIKNKDNYFPYKVKKNQEQVDEFFYSRVEDVLEKARAELKKETIVV